MRVRASRQVQRRKEKVDASSLPHLGLPCRPSAFPPLAWVGRINGPPVKIHDDPTNPALLPIYVPCRIRDSPSQL